MKGRAVRKVPGGKMVKAQVVYGETLAEVTLTGDFFLHPEEALEEVESSLAGKPADAELDDIEGTVEEVLDGLGAEFVGVEPSDVAAAVEGATR